MYIYLVSQTINRGYDTYDSFVCRANTAEEAQHMLPWEHSTTDIDWNDWASPEDVSVEYLGIAEDYTEAGVIITSFNAG